MAHTAQVAEETARKRGQQPTDPSTVARALALRDEGYGDEDIGGQLGVSARAVRKWATARSRGTLWPAAMAQLAILRGEPPPAAPAPQAAPRALEAKMPPGLAPLEQDLWIIDQEITATRTALAEARASGRVHGLASLGKLLADLVQRRAELRPPPPPTEDEEERRWRADADSALRKLRAGLANPGAAA